MNEVALRQPRRVLPRWRLFNTTARLGELVSPKVKDSELPKLDDGALILKRWKTDKTCGVASEVLNLAITKQDTALAKQAASFIENRHSFEHARTPLECVALATLRTDGNPHDDEWLQSILRPSQRDIPNLRKSLRLFLRNAVAWAELALLHAWNGNKEHARRCMTIAVGLAPNDRFVLRSAVRCFAHLRQHTIGLELINRSERTKNDPWLLSAQIAMAQALDKPQRLMKNAKAMIESKAFKPWDLSELNAAIGSVLHHDGAEKNANKHFRASLIEPTENALCQVIFDRQSPDWRKITGDIHPTRNFESEARFHYLSLELDKACESARGWLEDEPFSARPAMFGSFVAGIALENHQEALDFVEQGLKPNPNNPALLNNKALILARVGRTAEADDALARARLCHDGDSEMAVVLDATEGLILFRKGEVVQGRRKYLDAIDAARRAGRIGQEGMARVFLAREELDAKTDLAQAAIQEAEASVKKLSHRHADTYIAMSKLMAEAAKVGQAGVAGIKSIER